MLCTARTELLKRQGTAPDPLRSARRESTAVLLAETHLPLAGKVDHPAPNRELSGKAYERDQISNNGIRCPQTPAIVTTHRKLP
jgi:hypothetical protein